jgi:SAM-dependent methyltransferase
VDGSRPGLEAARGAAARAGVEARFVEAELRELPFAAGRFDAAISLFSSIGYGGDAGTAQVLAEAARVLGPGGRLLVEVLGRDQAVRAFGAARDWSVVDGCVVRVTRWLDLVRGEECARFEYDRGVGPREKSFRRRLFTPTELERMLLAAGFASVRFHGDYDGGALGLDSPGLLAVARKGAA